METHKERLQREKEKQEFVSSMGTREDYRETFSTPSGRRVLKDLLQRGHMLETTCSGNAWSYFYEGERNWVLRISTLIPDLVGEVFKEIMDERHKEAQSIAATILQGESNE